VKVAAQHLEAIGRYGHAVAQVAIGAPIKIRELNRRTGCFHDFDCLGNYFFADSIAGEDGDFFLVAHQRGRYHNFFAAIISDPRRLCKLLFSPKYCHSEPL